MDVYEFSALQWLLENVTYLRVLENYGRTFLVVYEQLCVDPLKIANCLFEFLRWPMGLETERFINDSTGRQQSFEGRLKRIVNRYFGIYKDTTRVAESWRSGLQDSARARIISIAGLHPYYQSYWPE